MGKLITIWDNSKIKLPDEKYLEQEWEAEVENIKVSLEEQETANSRLKKNTSPLLKAAGLSSREVSTLIREDAKLADQSIAAAEKRLEQPKIDYSKFHKMDLEQAKEHEKKIKTQNPSWRGYLRDPAYGNWWGYYNGESEEKPVCSTNKATQKIDPRAQTWGEGWWDTDFSLVHGYLAFQFSPPSWGHLHIHTYPWIHGYYSLYSNDTWYKSEYARAEVDTWIDVYQNYWRPRNYRRRFTMSGYELHPSRSGRIDGRFHNTYYTNVGETDTVTIRVGIRLYCQARAGGGRSRLNFRSGAANYMYVPYVYWYLHQ